MTEVQDKYAATAWGKNKDFKKPFDVDLPSGQKVLARRLEMTDILRLGIIEELDFFSKALAEGEKEAEAKKDEDQEPEESSFGAFAKVLAKSKNFDALEVAVNAVVQTGVIAPKLHVVPTVTHTETVDGKRVSKTKVNESARQDGLLYVDEIPLTDRLALFGEIFDMEGLSTFREEPETGVGDVQPVEDVQLPTE